MKNETYNGWSNYETWNVALWISNNEVFYNLAKDTRDYSLFVHDLRELVGLNSELAGQTPDQVMWSSPLIDINAINEMIGEI